MTALKLKVGDRVTPKTGTDPQRLLIYYWRYYFNGTYGDQYRLQHIRMKPGTVGVIRARCPSVFTEAPHTEFLAIDFCEPITGKVQRVALHDSELIPVTVAKHGRGIPRVGARCTTTKENA